jgi:hypothetical protein
MVVYLYRGHSQKPPGLTPPYGQQPVILPLLTHYCVLLTHHLAILVISSILLVHLGHRMLEGSIIVSREGEAMRNIVFDAQWTANFGLGTACRSWLLVLIHSVQKFMLNNFK